MVEPARIQHDPAVLAVAVPYLFFAICMLKRVSALAASLHLIGKTSQLPVWDKQKNTWRGLPRSVIDHSAVHQLMITPKFQQAEAAPVVDQ